MKKKTIALIGGAAAAGMAVTAHVMRKKAEKTDL